LITRAVTAPFSLLASAFGGGSSGEELSYIEFDNGRANLDEPDRAKIATLAKALNNRPALSLEIIGRADPLSDLDGLKRVGIERKACAMRSWRLDKWERSASLSSPSSRSPPRRDRNSRVDRIESILR